ncbi:hypothetical protein [Rhizobium sp. Root1220]|uniref:hypothetical protein n=1 Tax=Rhizobium sp. Root1220 TaxID=1736432 RepID=UPI000700CEEF|nr:hypothetical protein [Rhizobium sp. Root1220]KQV73394.1 hypothetical protein ASC90_07320 [Rhizobium sp. Root1220]
MFIGRVDAVLSLVGSTGFLASLAVFTALPAASASAADCKQANAVYSDRDGAYELRFTPINSESAAASNQFKLKILKTSIVLDGYVMASEDPERAVGILMFDCPGGDVTGDDLNACTVWQGAVYGMDAKGEVDNLQPEAATAAARIVLPGLGPAIRSSSVWGIGKAQVAPWDVLAFKECGK